MGKATKITKKSTTKSSKSNLKTKINSKNITSKNGAPEIEDDEITNQHETEMNEIKLIRRAMKVKHRQIHEKQIRKATRSLNKLKKTQATDEEIQAAEVTLQKVTNELEEASQWMHPTETLNKLNEILELQIDNQADIDIIEITKNHIIDAEESQNLILQGKKEAWFFRIIEVNTSNLKENEEEGDDNDTDDIYDQNKFMDIEMEEVNEDSTNLPKILPQNNNHNSDNSEMSDIEDCNEEDENENQVSLITPLKSQTKISDFIQNSNDGDTTPKTKTSEIPINVMQEKLQNALKVLTPQEKMQKIRMQAKANAIELKRKAKEAQLLEKNCKHEFNQAKKQTKSFESIKKNTIDKESTNKNKQTITNIEDNKSKHIIKNCESKTVNYKENDQYQEENDSQDDEDFEEQEQSPSKKKQSKINLTRNYNTYFSIKLKVEKGIATKQLLKSLKTFFDQLYEIDPQIAIYEYDPAIPSKAILNPKNLPNDYAVMKTFFNNINVKPNGGHSWFQIWIGHDEPVDNLLINMKHWSSENDSYMYKKRLQEKYTSKEYWLLWSTERMDPEILKEQIDDITMKIENKKYNLSFNFGMIRKDPKFTNNNQPSKWNKAMIIEVKREEKEEAYRVLGRIFSTSNNIKILGTEMRMIPVMSSDLPSHTKRKIARMTHKQEQFLSTLVTKPCVYLSEIDYFNTKLKTTLRDMIMNLETLKTFDPDGNPMKIFLNVDYSNWHSSYVLTFPKHLEKEADDFIAQMPAYLQYVYGEEVLYMLTAEGAVKANESKWDEENLCATSNLDLELDAIELESSNKAWIPNLKEDIIAFDTNQIEMQGKLHDRATDADSVSTFASKVVPLVINNPEEDNTEIVNNNHQSNSSHQNHQIQESETDNSENSKQKQISYSYTISTDEENSESSSTNSPDEDPKARQPEGRGAMINSKSAVSDLEGSL